MKHILMGVLIMIKTGFNSNTFGLGLVKYITKLKH